VFFPITERGRAGSTLRNWAARAASASNEISMPGANAPPRNSPRELMTSKLVVVPKSTTIDGPPKRVYAASVFTTRSAPTSFGLSMASWTPVFTPGSTTRLGMSA
jgi:hypothetical protein